jgi:hypothetical protein
MKVNDEYRIVLLEFKAPFGTIPDNRIPVHYLPQVKTGLCTIDISEEAIYVSNMFRRCKIDQLNFTPSYDVNFHRDANKKLDLTEAVAYGVILFHISGQHIDTFLSKYIEETDVCYESESDAVIAEVLPKSAGFSIQVPYSTHSDDDDEEELSEDSEDEECNLLEKLHKNVSLFINTNLDPNSYKLIDLGNSTTSELEEFLTLYKNDSEESFLTARYIKPNLNCEFIMNNNKDVFISNDINYIKTENYLNKINKKYNFKKTIEKFKANSLKKDAFL